MTDLGTTIVTASIALLLCCTSVIAQEKDKGEAKASPDSSLVQSVQGADLFHARCASCTEQVRPGVDPPR